MIADAEASYWALEHQAESKAKSIIENFKMGVCFWETKDKTKVNVSKMTDSHLINTLNMLSRNIELFSELTSITTRAWIKVLSCEKIKREL